MWIWDANSKFPQIFASKLHTPCCKFHCGWFLYSSKNFNKVPYMGLCVHAIATYNTYKNYKIDGTSLQSAQQAVVGPPSPGELFPIPAKKRSELHMLARQHNIKHNKFGLRIFHPIDC